MRPGMPLGIRPRGIVAKRYIQAILNRDNKLSLALNAVGEAQRQQTIDAIGREGTW